jgi:hypothetical protein
MGLPWGSGARVRPSRRGGMVSAALQQPEPTRGRGRPPPPGGAYVAVLDPLLIDRLEKEPRTGMSHLLRRAPNCWRGSEARTSSVDVTFGDAVPTCGMDAAGTIICKMGLGLMAPSFEVTLEEMVNLAPTREDRACTARRRVALPPPATSATGGSFRRQLSNSGLPWTTRCPRRCMGARLALRAGVPPRRPRGSACVRRPAATAGIRAGARCGRGRAAGSRASSPAAASALRALPTPGGPPLAGHLRVTARP